MISPERFLDLLEEKELLSPGTVASLRKQLAQSPKPITAEVLAQRLIKHGRLTADQAKRLLAADDETPPPAPKPLKSESSDLALAPLDDESDAAKSNFRRCRLCRQK
jgi:hypothetical protein